MSNQVVQQLVIVDQTTVNKNNITTPVALFDESGTSVSVNSQTGADVLLTGYEAGDADALAASDTVNEAFAKIEAGLAKTGADVVLTGYTSGTAGAVAATDTVNAAIAKLEARIAALESA